MLSLRRILFPTDFGPQAEHAQLFAVELARKFQSELHLLHVIVPMSLPAIGVPDMGYFEDPTLITELEQSSLHALENMLPAEFQAHHQVVKAIRTGTPVEQIVSYAAEQQIDLIVIGTVGRTGLEHLLLGSLAEHVVRKAHCPVLAVHPKDQIAEEVPASA